MFDEPTYNIVGRWVIWSDGCRLPLIAGREGEGSSGDGGTGDSGEEEEEEEEEEDKTKSKAKASLSDDERKRLNDEAARQRRVAKTERDARLKVEADLKAIQDKDKSESEKVTGERDQLKEWRAKHEPVLRQQAVELEVMKEIGTFNFSPKRTKSVMKVLDRDSIEIDDNFSVTGVKEALASVAKEYPEWIVKPGSGDESDDGGAGGTGKSAGRSFSSQSQGDKVGNFSKAELERKFPALRR